MEDLEILSTIPSRAENPTGMADIFSDRLSIKSKVEKWKNFPPCTLSKVYLDYHATVRDFQVYDDDIWLCGFPRSGTVLLQELLWLIINNYDFEGAKVANPCNRANWFE